MTFIDQNSFINRCAAVILGLSLLTSAFTVPFSSLNVAEAAGPVIITNTAELEAAINNQADGQTWTIQAGDYDLSPNNSITVPPSSPQTGWYFPITADNLTINGVGNPTIYSSDFSANGAWHTQDLIAVFGDNVTITGLTLMPKVEPNKTLEVIGSDFTIEDVTFTPNTKVPASLYNGITNPQDREDLKQWGGSLYFFHAGHHVVKNVTINNGGISFSNSNIGAGTDISFDNVNLVYKTNVDWINGYRYSAGFADTSNTLTGTPQVTYHVDSTLANAQSAFGAAQDGDTIEIDSDITTTKQLDAGTAVTIDGNGHTIDAAFTKNGNSNNSAIGVGSDGVTIKDITVDGTNGTDLHGINVYRSTDVVVQDITAKNFRTGLLVNGSEVDASDITTSGNAWHGINVDKGDATNPAKLTIHNTSVQSENSPTPPASFIPGADQPHIFLDTGGDFNTVDDVDSQYDMHEFPSGMEVYTLKSTDVAAPTMSDIKMYVDRGSGYEESDVVRPGDNVRIEVEAEDTDSGIADVEFRIQAQDGQYVTGIGHVATPVSGTTYQFDYQVPADGKYVNTHAPMNTDINGHKFWARATDNAGNYHNGLRGDFTFDTVVPEMSNIKMYVKQGTNYVESDVVMPGDFVRIEVEASDAAGDIADVEFRIQAQDGQYVTWRDYVDTPVSGNLYQFDYQVPTDGKYINTHNPMNETVDGHKFWARATDEAGNYNHGLRGDFTFKTEVTGPTLCHLPYTVEFDEELSDVQSVSTDVSNGGFAIDEVAGGYTIGLYNNDTTKELIRAKGTITFPAGTDTNSFAFVEAAGKNQLEQGSSNYPDVADRNGNTIEFDLYVNVAHDIFTITDDTLENEENCDVVFPAPTAKIVASKLVCDDEALLPNGDIGNIDADTAADYAAEHDGCELQEGFAFQWVAGPMKVNNAPDNAGMLSDWNTSAPTDSDGKTTMSINLADLDGETTVSVREAMQTGYLPFSGMGGSNVSAEMYCTNDVAHYDNLEWIKQVEADKTYHCVAWNVVDEAPTADVTMCKYDQSEVALEGWQLALLGNPVTDIDVKPDGTTQSLSSVPAGDYVLKASGTFEYRGSTGLLNDAQFSERTAAEIGSNTIPYDPWYKLPNGKLAVQVNGDSSLWGSVFNPAHEYYGSYTPATAGDIDFVVDDSDFTDNVGTINVALYNGYTGVTNDNGCVTFKDVPYGTYNVEELMQDGWENESGLGEVTVDEEHNHFEVVNTDPEYVEMCTLDVVSNDQTVIVQSNDFATSTYEHPRWTADIDGAEWVWNSEYVNDPETDETLTFHETFTVATPTVGTLAVAADNGYVVTINGHEVIDRSLPDYENNYQDHTAQIDSNAIDVTSFLQAGENTLEITVTNQGTAGSNAQANPAGVLYKLTVEAEKAENSCVLTTEPEVVPESSLEITNPATDDEVLPRSFTFMADYQDADDDEDTVFWSIRANTCSSANHVIGNVPGRAMGTSTFNATTGAFSAPVDMSSWSAGDYCLVVNPREDDGAPTDERETRMFTLESTSTGGTNPEPTPASFLIDGAKYNDEDGNGEWDEELESGLGGWVINLYSDNGDTLVDTTTTDSHGYYSFIAPEGDYWVYEEQQTGWTQTAPASQNDAQAGYCAMTLEDDGTHAQLVLLDGEESAEGGLLEGESCIFGNHQNTGETDGGGEDDQTPENGNNNHGGGAMGTLVDLFNAPEDLQNVLGASTESTICPFLVDHMQISWENNPWEVIKLQLFLRIVMGYDQPINGVFGATTDTNVKAFQERYKDEVLTPWFLAGIVPHDRPTGFVYKTTKWKINDIVCPGLAAFPSLEGETLNNNVAIN